MFKNLRFVYKLHKRTCVKTKIPRISRSFKDLTAMINANKNFIARN